MSEQTSDIGLTHQFSAMLASMPPNLSSALTTPIRAPPAIKPLAMSVPFSPRSLFTYQLIAPPTNSGTFNSNGMNIPSAKANAGILK